MPVMVTVVLTIIAFVRKEPPRWLAPSVAVFAVLVAFSAGARMNASGENPVSNSASSLAAAKLRDWSWLVEPEFVGGAAKIKWTATVRNISARPISLVKVEFRTYDGNRRILSSDITYIKAIAPRAERTVRSRSDYYGTEKAADAQVVEARFAD
jgi:hypothetical protein